MKLNYVIWDTKRVENSVLLDSLQNVERKWELRKGVPRAADFTAEARFQMNLNLPYNTILTDNLRNKNMLIVASQRFKEFFEEWQLDKVEYLPVIIIDHKGKPIHENYFIIHPIHPVSCLNIEKCGADWSSLDEDSIDYVDHLVIDESFIDTATQSITVDRKLFRPKHFDRITFVQRNLAEAIDEAGFTGVEWMEINEYSDD